MGDQMTGSFCALPIWVRFMETVLPMNAEEFYPNTTLKPEEMDFTEPPGMVWIEMCRESGQLSGNSCPVHVMEAFLPGTEPTEPCTIHSSEVTPNDFMGF